MPFPTQLLQHSITVYPSSTAADGSGGLVVSYSATPRASGVPAIIRVASAIEQERFAREGVVVTHVIMTQGTAGGTEQGDRVVGFDNAGATVGSFDVKGIRRQPGIPYIDLGGHCFLDVENVLA